MSRVNWSKSSSISNMRIYPSLNESSTFLVEERNDSFVMIILELVFSLSPASCLSSQLIAWFSGSNMMGRLLRWYKVWIILGLFRSSWVKFCRLIIWWLLDWSSYLFNLPCLMILSLMYSKILNFGSKLNESLWRFSLTRSTIFSSSSRWSVTKTSK